MEETHMQTLPAILIASVASLGLIGTAEADSYGFATFSASVNPKGNVLRSSGVQSSVRNNVGSYVVTFSRAVNTCTFVGSPIGSEGGQVSVQVSKDTNKLRVSTFSNGGVRADLGFALLVSCSS
jgi:hypothetical protein